MRKILLAICILLGLGKVSAQIATSWKQTDAIPGKFSYFKPDDLGNIFALTLNGQLKKYNAAHDSMGVFNDVRRYGRLHSISSGNALRTLLYFKEYRTLLILDRLMQVVNKIDLRKANAFQASLAALGYDNSIWIFDEQDSKVKKINEEGSLLFETADLRIVLGEAIAPNTLFDLGGLLYLYDPQKGLFIFDYYGGLKKKIALLDWKAVQPLGKNIAGIKNGKLMLYTPDMIDLKESELPENIKNSPLIYFTPRSVLTMDATGIRFFEWKNN
jgi:hypothetical protein